MDQVYRKVMEKNFRKKLHRDHLMLLYLCFEIIHFFPRHIQTSVLIIYNVVTDAKRLSSHTNTCTLTLPVTLLLRRLVAKLLSSLSPNNAQVMSSGRRARRDLSVTAAEPVSSAHRRTRRSLDDLAPPLPSNDPPLLRVKRLEEEEEKLRPPAAGLQRMKRIDTMEIATMEELNHGSRRRRRRAALNYDPQILIDQIMEYMRE